MKNKKQKTPKSCLPKFGVGGNSTEGTQNIYNDKRSSKLNIGQYANYATAAVNLGVGLSNNQKLSGAAKNQANANTINGTVDAVAGSATPWYGYAKTASGIGKSLTSPTSVTDPTTGETVTQSSNRTNQAFSDTFTPVHETAINDFTSGNAGRGALDIVTSGVWNTMDNYLNGTNQKKFDKAKANEANYNKQQTELANQQNAAAQQQQNDYINSAIQSGLANQQPQNSYVQYAMGGMKMQPNAEVEKQENTLNPDGSTNQYDGASHEQGGIPTNLDAGTLIFSDKLKMGGKTFAKLNKPNMTSKEDKILSDDKASAMSKLTANLMKQAKNKSSVELFEAQEALKQSKIDSYTKRLGGIMKYPDGGKIPSYLQDEINFNKKLVEDYGSAILGSGMQSDMLNNSKIGLNKFDILLDYKSKDVPDHIKYSSDNVNKLMNGLKFYEDKYQKHSNGGIQKYPNGGITPQQYKQAQSDSMTLYNAGLQSNKRPYYDYPGTVEAMQRLQGINSNNGKIVAPEPIQGEAYSNVAGYNGGYNVKFQKPTMVPYRQTQIPADNNGIEKVESYAQPIGKPVNHPVYNQYIPGINQSKQPIQTEEFKKGGVKLPQYDEGGAFIDGVWVPNSSYKPGTMGFNDSGNTPNNPSNYSLQSSYNPNVLPWNRTNDSKQGPNGKSEQYVNDNPQQQFQEETLNNNTNSYFPETKSNKFDWKGLGTQALSFAANNAGNIYDLARSNKPEVTKFQRATASLLDPTAALRDATEQTRRAEYNVRNASGGNAGTYLSNRVGLNAQNIENKDRIRQSYANANAGISNQVNQVNTSIANQEYVANEQNRAASRNTKQGAIASIGSNSANQMNDIRNTKMDQKKMEGLIKMYPSLSKDPKMLEYFMSFNA